MKPLDLAEIHAERLRQGASIVRMLDSLGDRVGPNDPALSNALWHASTIVREALAAARERAKVGP